MFAFAGSNRIFESLALASFCAFALVCLPAPARAQNSSGVGPLSIPLTIKTGASSGVSLLYLKPAAAAPGANASPAGVGVSNQFALGASGSLKGMAFLPGFGKKADGGAGQIIAQSLEFGQSGWKFEAHHTTVGKDAGLADLKNAAASLGLLGGMSGDGLSALEPLRGKSANGLSLNYAANRNRFGFLMDNGSDDKAKIKTNKQSLTFGRTFGGGLNFDVSHEVVTSQSFMTAGAAATGSATNRLQLGLSRGRGLSLNADARTVALKTGVSEQHMTLGLSGNGSGLDYKANFASDTDSKGRADQTLGLDMARQFQSLAVGISVSESDKKNLPGVGAQKLTLGWKARPNLSVDGFYTRLQNPDGLAGTGNSNLLHLNWQVRPDLTFEARWAQESRTRWADANADRQLILRGLIARNVQIEASVASKMVGATAQASDSTDIKTTFLAPSLAAIHNARLVLTVGRRGLSGQNISAANNLAFDGELRKNAVHLEYAAATNTAVDKKRVKTTARALRIVSDPSARWLAYNLYYKNRKTSAGPPLPDISDYQLRMQVKSVALIGRYTNQRENPDGTVTDVVQSSVALSGPWSRKLAWNAQYAHSDVAAGTAGIDGCLFGLKGSLHSGGTLEMAAGYQEMRLTAGRVGGETLKVNYQAKTSETDSVSLDGQMTAWNKKTDKTPLVMDATVRLDVKKVY